MTQNRANAIYSLILLCLAACGDKSTAKPKTAGNASNGVHSGAADGGAVDAAARASSDDDASTNGALTTGCKTTSSTVPCSDDPDPCGLHSGFDGDEYCILPPPPGKGIQIHFGPSDYTDSDEVAKYTLQPGQEYNGYGIAHVPSSDDHWFNFVQIRMRPGSHHLINTVVQGDDLQEGYLPDGQGCPGTTIGSFPGTQNLVFDSPPGGKQAPENVGIGSMLTGDSSICLNHHAYNFDDDKVHLREVWMNVWFVDESEVTQRTSPVTIAAGPWTGIPAHTQQVLTKTTTISGTGRIISMFGHRHTHTDRFAVWHNDELVYDSWHWQESVVFDYDSITTNPATDPMSMVDGATSGILNVVPGDQIKVECDVNNTTDQPLTFRNELNTGEMCILFGSAVGVTIKDYPGTTAPAP
jgi:hypothetical protein